MFRLAALLWIAAGAFAQPPSTKLLAFDLAAVDARGNLVADLQASDLRVTDNGRAQSVVYFRRGADRTPLSKVLAGERSNYAYPTFPSTVVVLLDQLNSTVELTGGEWQEISQSLGRLEELRGIYFYLLTKNGALYPIHGFPDSWLAASARAVSPKELLPLFDEMRRRYTERSSDLDASRAAEGDPHFNLVMKRKQLHTQNALQEIATGLSALPGAKSIVWIGNRRRRPLDSEPTQAIEAEWGEAPDAVPVYYTGIRFDIRATIERALADAGRGYRIGYYPAADNWDGRFHKLRISCKRPGVTIRAATGYKAVKPVDVEDDARQSDADLVALSPFDSSAIGFRATELSGAGGPVVELNINPGDLLSHSILAQVIHYRVDGEVEVLQDAMRVDGAREEMVVRLPIAQSTSVAGWRIVVLDPVTRAFGTLTMPARRRR